MRTQLTNCIRDGYPSLSLVSPDELDDSGKLQDKDLLSLLIRCRTEPDGELDEDAWFKIFAVYYRYFLSYAALKHPDDHIATETVHEAFPTL